MTQELLRNLIAVCPKLKHIDTLAKTSLKNSVIIPLLEEFPDIQFDWIVHIKTYKVASNATAFSTKRGAHYGTPLNSEDCELFKYVPGLRALDLGHHDDIVSLDFLKYFP